MSFLSPLALVLLLPWAAACVWGGRRANAAARVPFVKLWPRTAAVAGRRRVPPMWVVLLLTATLLTILAAAGPAIQVDASAITVVVDRGPSMTPSRLHEAATRLRLGPATRVRVVPVPGEPYDAVGGIDERQLPPSTLATDAAVRQAVLREGECVVLSNHALPLSNAGIDRFALSSPPPLGGGGGGRGGGGRAGGGALAIGAGADGPGAGVDARKAAVSPPPNPLRQGEGEKVTRPTQALVRVFNGTNRRQAIVDVDGVRRPIVLPEMGQTVDVFIDLPSPGDACVATLLAEDGRPWRDDVPGDDTAFLAAVARPGRVEPKTAVSDTLARLIAVYARHRPAAPDATAVAIVRGGPPAGPGVVLAKSLSPADGTAVSVDAGHPVSRSLDPRRLGDPARSSAPPPGDGWRSLAAADGVPLLAVRDSPARQVWIGFDTDAIAGDAGYVVFWAGVFDWLAGGEPAWAARPVGTPGTVVRVADAGLDGSPGLYRDTDGRPFATAMPAVRRGGGVDQDDAAARRLTRVDRPLSSPFLFVAIGFAAAAMAAARLDRPRTDP